MEKFSRTGYGFKSVDYRNIYTNELEAFWKELENLTTDGILKIMQDIEVP
jgi:hypothetical protein